MPFHTRTDPARRLAVAVAEPAPSNMDERMTLLRSIAADPAFTPAMGVLIDARAVTNAPTFDEAGELARTFADPRVLGGHPVALLLDGPLHVGVGQMLSARAALVGGLVRAFTDEAEAYRWLHTHTASGRGV